MSALKPQNLPKGRREKNNELAWKWLKLAKMQNNEKQEIR